MDNRAQLPFEYLTIMAILTLISALVLVFASLLIFNKEGTKTAMAAYKQNLLNMLG
jgi:hypothetical protein